MDEHPVPQDLSVGGRKDERTAKMFINKRLAIPLGMLCLTISILLNRFGGGLPHVAFFEGMFLGLSLTFNIFGLILIRSRASS